MKRSGPSRRETPKGVARPARRGGRASSGIGSTTSDGRGAPAVAGAPPSGCPPTPALQAGRGGAFRSCQGSLAGSLPDPMAVSAAAGASPRPTTSPTTMRSGASQSPTRRSSSRSFASRDFSRGCPGSPSCGSGPPSAGSSRASTRRAWPASALAAWSSSSKSRASCATAARSRRPSGMLAARWNSAGRWALSRRTSGASSPSPGPGPGGSPGRCSAPFPGPQSRPRSPGTFAAAVSASSGRPPPTPSCRRWGS